MSNLVNTIAAAAPSAWVILLAFFACAATFAAIDFAGTRIANAVRITRRVRKIRAADLAEARAN